MCERALFSQAHLNLYIYLGSFHDTFYINSSDLFLIRLPAQWEQKSDHKYKHSYLRAWILASQQSGQVCLCAVSTSAGVNVGVPHLRL